jgi:hypothetical protein
LGPTISWIGVCGAIMAIFDKVYKDMQKKAKQLIIMCSSSKSSIYSCAMCCLFDHYDKQINLILDNSNTDMFIYINCLLTHSTDQSASCEANQFSPSQRNSLHFIEPKVSLLCLQVPPPVHILSLY